MTFGPCQETSYAAITLNPESNFTRREKNHSLFHWTTLTYPELLIRIWMSSKRNASMIIGISMGQETCLILEPVSLDLFYWKKKHPDGYILSGGDKRENSLHPGQIIYGQRSGKQWERMWRWRRSKGESSNWECLFVHREKGFFLICVCGWHQSRWKETKHWSDVECTQ